MSDHSLEENPGWDKKSGREEVKTETHFVLISSEQNLNRLETYLPEKFYC